MSDRPDIVSDRVARRFQAKSKGQETRAALNNISIGLNNLWRSMEPVFSSFDYFADVQKKIQNSINDITKQVFKVHVPEIKKYIVAEVVSSLKEGLNQAAKGATKAQKGEVTDHYEARAVQQAIYTARESLKTAVKMLEEHPDNDELKERLSSTLAMLLPSGNSKENWYKEAIRLSGELARSEKGKKAQFFSELMKGLESAYSGYQDLRSAAAFSHKVLPKAR